MGPGYAKQPVVNPDQFLKMNGRKLYEFALQHVPAVIQTALTKAGLELANVSKVLLHQANHKMNVALLERLCQLYNYGPPDRALMPMTIGWLGNSSVATLPTLLDLLCRGHLANQRLEPGDTIVIASVGAGMNINAVVYQV